MHVFYTFLILLVTALALGFHDYAYERDAVARDTISTFHHRKVSEEKATKLSTRGFELKVPFYSKNLREVLNMFDRNQVKPMGESLLQLDLTGAGDNVPITNRQMTQLAASKKLWEDYQLDKAITTTLPKFAKRTTGLDTFVDEMIKTLKNYKARLDRIEATIEAKKLSATHTDQNAAGRIVHG